MKKTINITIMLIVTLLLSSCFTSNDEINKAKQDLGIIETKKELTNEVEKAKQDMLKEETPVVEELKEVVKNKKIEIESLTDEQFLEFDNLESENIFDGEVEITGKTLGQVDKIIVKFSNESSEFPDDVFTLKQFSSGDDTFLYRAFSRFETLDVGKNIYVFEAHSGTKVTELQLIINVVKEEEKAIEKKIEEITEDISISSLPVGAAYGSPQDLGDNKITYSDIKGLEIKKEINSDLTCENITSFLTDKINTWFFWNTCRPVESDEGISFFVIKLNGEGYVYEKHYYLSYQGIYGVQELETGTGVVSTNINEKNSELKELNENYSILEVTDALFKDILN